jgi:hypothetical protein
MQQRINLQFLSPASLIPYAKNAKIHSEDQIERIAHQISSFGFDQPIVTDKDLVIIKGHGRLRAAQKLNLQEVPVVVAEHLNEEEKIAARIADNRVAEAPWDPDLLKFDLNTLDLKGFNMKLTGFSIPEVKAFLSPLVSGSEFSDSAHKSVHERTEEYENSDLRQMILVMDPESFETMIAKFQALQNIFAVETNLEVVQKLLEFYESKNASN